MAAAVAAVEEARSQRVAEAEGARYQWVAAAVGGIQHHRAAPMPPAAVPPRQRRTLPKRFSGAVSAQVPSSSPRLPLSRWRFMLALSIARTLPTDPRGALFWLPPLAAAAAAARRRKSVAAEWARSQRSRPAQSLPLHCPSRFVVLDSPLSEPSTLGQSSSLPRRPPLAKLQLLQRSSCVPTATWRHSEIPSSLSRACSTNPQGRWGCWQIDSFNSIGPLSPRFRRNRFKDSPRKRTLSWDIFRRSIGVPWHLSLFVLRVLTTLQLRRKNS